MMVVMTIKTNWTDIWHHGGIIYIDQGNEDILVRLGTTPVCYSLFNDLDGIVISASSVCEQMFFANIFIHTHMLPWWKLTSVLLQGCASNIPVLSSIFEVV